MTATAHHQSHIGRVGKHDFCPNLLPDYATSLVWPVFRQTAEYSDRRSPAELPVRILIGERYLSIPDDYYSLRNRNDSTNRHFES
jgi:hypothetical protein